jgi:hypothetical protein
VTVVSLLTPWYVLRAGSLTGIGTSALTGTIAAAAADG